MDSKQVGQGPENQADQERKAWAVRRAHCPLFSSLSSLPPCCSLNRQKNLVELSFLPGDTGKPDVFPASLGLPFLKQEERKMEAEDQEHKGEEQQQKNQNRKGKRNEEGQEAVRLPGKKKEPQKPQAKKQGKRPRQESAGEQVRPSGRMASLMALHRRAFQSQPDATWPSLRLRAV